MPADLTLEVLIAGGHYAIAADRSEEETGDSELATLMRIDGLEWELVDGVPALRMNAKVVDIDNGWLWWWQLHCGKFDFGSVSYESDGGDPRPRPLAETPIHSILASAGLKSRFRERFYTLYKEAVARIGA